MYKKYARDGYLQKASEVVKKSKKGGDENFYNSMDPFIDDAEHMEESERKEPVYSDFRAEYCSLEEIYKEIYTQPEAPKRKPERF